MQELLGFSKSSTWIIMKLFKKFKCDRCDSKFSKQEELMHHMELIHFKDAPYDCKECELDFSSMEEMRTHLQRKHSYRKS